MLRNHHAGAPCAAMPMTSLRFVICAIDRCAIHARRQLTTTRKRRESMRVRTACGTRSNRLALYQANAKVTGHERLTMKTENAPTSAPADRLVGPDLLICSEHKARNPADWICQCRNEVAVSSCLSCGGTGVVDSGGVTPWGASIDVPFPECGLKGMPCGDCDACIAGCPGQCVMFG